MQLAPWDWLLTRANVVTGVQEDDRHLHGYVHFDVVHRSATRVSLIVVELHEIYRMSCIRRL